MKQVRDDGFPEMSEAQMRLANKHFQEALQPTVFAKMLGPRQLAILRVLYSYGPDMAVYMKTISTLTDLDKKVVRRHLRVLARNGYVELFRGLMNEDTGMLAGSGYGITTKGCAYMRGEAQPNQLDIRTTVVIQSPSNQEME